MADIFNKIQFLILGIEVSVHKSWAKIILVLHLFCCQSSFSSSALYCVCGVDELAG